MYPGTWHILIILPSNTLPTQDCEKSIQQDPGISKPLLIKAAAMRSLDKEQEAMGAYRRVLELDPECQEAIQGLEECQETGTSDT